MSKAIGLYKTGGPEVLHREDSTRRGQIFPSSGRKGCHFTSIASSPPLPGKFGYCLPECHEMAGISPASCDPPIVGKDHFQPPAQLLLFRPLVSLCSISLSGTYPMSEQPIVMASRNVADSMSTGHASLYRGERRGRMNKQPIGRETVTV